MCFHSLSQYFAAWWDARRDKVVKLVWTLRTNFLLIFILLTVNSVFKVSQIHCNSRTGMKKENNQRAGDRKLVSTCVRKIWKSVTSVKVSCKLQLHTQTRISSHSSSVISNLPAASSTLNDSFKVISVWHILRDWSHNSAASPPSRCCLRAVKKPLPAITEHL